MQDICLPAVFFQIQYIFFTFLCKFPGRFALGTIFLIRRIWLSFTIPATISRRLNFCTVYY